MSTGNKIIISADPCGKFLEGIIAGTPKPGTVMQVKAATAAVGGRWTWEVYDAAADGNQRLIAVLLEDQLQGKLMSAAYAAGDRGFLYCPIAGEELNMLMQDVAGTGDDFAIGDILMVDDGTGKLIATTGDPESEPFIGLEVVTDPTADHLMHCMFTGY